MNSSSPTKTRTGTRSEQGWCMPTAVQRFGSNLMSQQVWCWGRDVEYRDGNLLMAYGFQRHRDSEDEDRSTCYRLDRDELHICLWGFGMFFGRRDLGGIFLHRFDFRPRWAPIESLSLAVHWPDELPVFGRPQGKSQWSRARALWNVLLVWIADYETWVEGHAGLAYRRECVDTWLRPFVRAEKMANAWQFLSRYGWRQKQTPIGQVLKKYTIPKKTP